MKRLTMGLAAAAVFIFATSAFALTPICANGYDKGTKCTINGSPHYACGDNSFVKTSHGLGACKGGARVNVKGTPLKKDAVKTKQPIKR